MESSSTLSKTSPNFMNKAYLRLSMTGPEPFVDILGYDEEINELFWTITNWKSSWDLWDCGSVEFPPTCDVDEDWEDQILRQENDIADGDDGPSDMMEIAPITITLMKVAWRTLRVAFEQRCEF